MLGTLAKLSTRTLLMIRSDHRLGLHRNYRKTAEQILINRGVALGEISVVGQKPGRPPKEE